MNSKGVPFWGQKYCFFETIRLLDEEAFLYFELRRYRLWSSNVAESKNDDWALGHLISA